MVCWPMACLRATLLAAGLAASACAPAQTGTGANEDRRGAFRVCDAKAFLALNIARNYMMTGNNRDTVIPHLQGEATAVAMAEEVFRRIDAGQVRHPGEVAADVLFECAAQYQINVGAPRQQVALCFTRTDIAFFLHAERSRQVPHQSAVARVQARLTSRELYPAVLIDQVAKAVYASPELPALQPLMGQMAWSCIHKASLAAAAASAASR
ncbi:MAG TPA: hypothetical protein VI032_20455 [Burkholderiaceae bacterium]